MRKDRSLGKPTKCCVFYIVTNKGANTTHVPLIFLRGFDQALDLFGKDPPLRGKEATFHP